MSDHIGHLGICDDTFRLALVDERIHPTFKKIMVENREDAHMGSITRQADKWSVQLIVAVRETLAGRSEIKFPERKLAFAMGNLTHRAADRLTKPIVNCFRDIPGGSKELSSRVKVMQDVMVFKEVYNSGRGDAATPFTPDVIGGWTSEAQANFEYVFRMMFRRALIAMHTFNPDRHNIDPWLDAFFKGLQTFPKSLELYAQIAAEWPQDQVREYLVEKRFYDREDPIIHLARRIQHGMVANSEQVAEVHAGTDKHNSRYARALAKALDYLHAAGELFDGKITEEQASERFDIGVPELSIQE